ncbi:MAG: hypothetical protein ACM3PP_07110 [Candidatus Saccharibacteria bacterium]
MSNQINNLIEKLNEQSAGFQTMLEISKGQLNEVRRGDFPNHLDGFNKLLVNRQQLMTQMEEKEEEIKKIEALITKEYSIDYFQLSSLKDKMEPGQFERVSTSFNELGSILLEITKVDDEIESEARKRLTAAQKPKKINSSHAAAKAYKEASAKGKDLQD